MSKFAWTLISLLFVSTAFSQMPPPAAAAPKNSGNKKVSEWPSIQTLSVADKFESLEGRFKIALPQNIQGFTALTPKDTGSTVTGMQFTWKFSDAEIEGIFFDNPDSNLTGSATDLTSVTANSKQIVSRRYPNAKLVLDRQFEIGRLPYSHFLFDKGDGSYVSTHFFLDKKRVYSFLVTYSNVSVNAKLEQIFSTFQLITPESVEAALRAKYEALKPAPLPQTPVVPKLKSDVQDGRLRGKVRKVVVESEDQSGTWSAQGRNLGSVEYYDENGAMTQSDSYDSHGNPFEIRVYGYINGKRVSNSNTASYEYDPPPMAAPPTSKLGPQRATDKRYEYSYVYKYLSGNLVEMQMIYSDGRKGMRYVYKHSPNRLEEHAYSEDGKLNQRYLSILDAAGNEIEKTDFGLMNFDVYGDRKYKSTYEVDAAGNWIKQVTLKEVKVKNVTSWQPAHTTYRTITYY